MTIQSNRKRDGATPVMSQAGGVPGPMPRMGPPLATRGHPRSRRVMVKQRRRNLERASSTPNADQTNQNRQHQSSLNIVQINIDGISNKKTMLAHLFSEKDIHVALVQESQHQNTDPSISNYSHSECDHSKENCRGIITYIRNDITGTVEKIESARPADFHKFQYGTVAVNTSSIMSTIRHGTIAPFNH